MRAHNNKGVRMDEFDEFSDLSWQLFVQTGAINYYLLHKKTKKKEEERKRR